MDERSRSTLSTSAYVGKHLNRILFQGGIAARNHGITESRTLNLRCMFFLSPLRSAADRVLVCGVVSATGAAPGAGTWDVVASPYSSGCEWWGRGLLAVVVVTVAVVAAVVADTITAGP